MAKTIFEDGNPSLGILGTRVHAAWLNKVFAHRHDGRDEDGSAPSNYAQDTGAANAYVIALDPPLTAHVTGMPLTFKALAANTGASTLAVNGLAPAAIVDMGGNPLAAGAIRQGGLVCVAWDGSRYCMTSSPAAQNSGGGGGFVGQVAFCAASTPPQGWLECNGALVSRAAYAALFAVIGTTYGAGDGSTTFKLPDLRGEFIRGWDHGRGVDNGRAFGSAQADAFKSHRHTLAAPDGGSESTPYEMWKSPISGQDDSDGAYTNYTGGSETRPRNIAMMAVIKY